MVILKSCRSLFTSLFSGDMSIQAMILFLVMALPWAVFQHAMLNKCHHLLLRVLPLFLLLAGILIGEVMTVVAPGWDGLGWAILTNYLSYGLLGDLIGIAFWLIRKRTKKRTAA